MSDYRNRSPVTTARPTALGMIRATRLKVAAITLGLGLLIPLCGYAACVALGLAFR